MFKTLKTFLRLSCAVAERDAEIAKLKHELETERLRLAACGVIALSNTRESAARARTMHDDYWCASVSDVARAVDREMALREQLERTRAAVGAAVASAAAADVLAERERQVNVEGWTPEHDDAHAADELARAAAAYADKRIAFFTVGGYFVWPFGFRHFKPRSEREDYVRAAALLLAAIERIDREAQRG
jgi:hypothetical protein